MKISETTLNALKHMSSDPKSTFWQQQTAKTILTEILSAEQDMKAVEIRLSSVESKLDSLIQLLNK